MSPLKLDDHGKSGSTDNYEKNKTQTNLKSIINILLTQYIYFIIFPHIHLSTNKRSIRYID